MSLLIYEVYWIAESKENDALIKQFQTKKAAETYATLLNHLDRISSFYQGEDAYEVRPKEISDEIDKEDFKFPVGVHIDMDVSKNENGEIVLKRKMFVGKSDFVYSNLINEKKVPIRIAIYKEDPGYLISDISISISLIVPCKRGDTVYQLDEKAKIACRRVLKYLEDNHSISYETMQNAFNDEEPLIQAKFDKVVVGDNVMTFYQLAFNGFKEGVQSEELHQRYIDGFMLDDI